MDLRLRFDRAVRLDCRFKVLLSKLIWILFLILLNGAVDAKIVLITLARHTVEELLRLNLQTTVGTNGDAVLIRIACVEQVGRTVGTGDFVALDCCRLQMLRQVVGLWVFNGGIEVVWCQVV